MPRLAKVVYHGKLGTPGRARRARARRSRAPSASSSAAGALAAAADRAALLAKADLLTDMVGEFPELQGIMGGYYARHDGETDAVALAIEDHYKPRFAGDALPRGEVGVVVALADKLETLAGLFGIGQVPTGDKDPFALRRHALRRDPHADRAGPAAGGAGAGGRPRSRPSPPATADARAELMRFLYDRLAGYLRDLGYSAQEVDAVLALRPERWAELPQRLAAVRAFAALPEAPALAAANKRVGNILKKSRRRRAGGA